MSQQQTKQLCPVCGEKMKHTGWTANQGKSWSCKNDHHYTDYDINIIMSFLRAKGFKEIPNETSL